MSRYWDPGKHATNGLWGHTWNLVNIFVQWILLLWHNPIDDTVKFLHATTVELSWGVQNFDMVWILLFMQE